MAISCGYTSKSGLFLDSAHINIQYVTILKNSSGFTANVNTSIYTSTLNYKEGKLPLETISLQFEITPSENIFSQSYEELKKDSRFSNILDC